MFAERNDLYVNYRNYTESEKERGDIFMCAGFSIVIMWWDNSVFVCDIHSQNKDGYHDRIEKVVLSLKVLKVFV